MIFCNKIYCNNFFLYKYSFQRVPNQFEKLRRFQGVGGGGGRYDKYPRNGNSRGVGGLKQSALLWARDWIFFGTTY